MGPLGVGRSDSRGPNGKKGLSQLLEEVGGLSKHCAWGAWHHVAGSPLGRVVQCDHLQHCVSGSSWENRAPAQFFLCWLCQNNALRPPGMLHTMVTAEQVPVSIGVYQVRPRPSGRCHPLLISVLQVLVALCGWCRSGCEVTSQEAERGVGQEVEVSFLIKGSRGADELRWTLEAGGVPRELVRG